MTHASVATGATATRDFATSQWSDVEALRARLMERRPKNVAEEAQSFVEDLASTFSTVVLARVFLVTAFDRLDPRRRQFAARLAGRAPDAVPTGTQVLSLLGTFGNQEAWREVSASRGHLAIPLLSSEHARQAPMIARLLRDLDVDFAGLDDGRSIASRPMLGGRNARFLVPDARTTTNERGEYVIPARDFVGDHDVRTVFGMGGAYVDGTLVVAVVFTSEIIDDLVVMRFPSLISNFKMATSELLSKGLVY